MSSSSRPSLKLVAVAGLMFAATLSGSAQSRATISVEDYQRAERYMNYNTPLVSNGPVRATWLPGDRFWYRNTSATGSEFFLVDAVKGAKAPAFNHAAVAAAGVFAEGEETIHLRAGLGVALRVGDLEGD